MSSGFITEAELAERRRVRQEEWEKVRKADQPLEAPEEEYDHRSLYERLQEQKQKRDLEFEEAHRLKNMIKGLNDDEVEFLDLVDRSKLEEERKKSLEEEREMAEFRSKVANLQEESLEKRIQQEIRKPSLVKPVISSGRSSQSKLLAGAVVKKRSLDSADEKVCQNKRPRDTSKENCLSKENKMHMNNEENNLIIEENHMNNVDGNDRHSVTTHCQRRVKVGSLTCIGVLPGLGHYGVESSDEMDSDRSTDIEEETGVTYDLVGRKIKKNKSTNNE